MDRQKLLVIVVLAAAGLWLGDRLFYGPWAAEMAKLSTDIKRMQEQIGAAKDTIARGPSWNAKWKRLRERLDRPRESDTLNEFVIGIGALCSRDGVQELSTKIGREQKYGEKGEFLEYAVETSFKAQWSALVDILKAIKKEKEFLRVQRLAVLAKEKESRVDVEMRVSTIELVRK